MDITICKLTTDKTRKVATFTFQLPLLPEKALIQEVRRIPELTVAIPYADYEICKSGDHTNL